MSGGSPVRVGTAGWHYPDWEGVVYTKTALKGRSPITLLASLFDVLEINASYYRVPSPAMAEQWAATAEDFPRFLFTAKVHRVFTHDRSPSANDFANFRGFLLPLQEAERLGAILLQFPWSFRASEANWKYLGRLFDGFRDLPVVLEVRHDSWWNEDTFARLHDQGVSIANIDQPGLSHNIPPDEVLTGPIAYVRFHGRNAKAWWAKKEEYYGARYDYLYSHDELGEWVERIDSLVKRTPHTFAIFNNHYRGEAVANGLDLSGLLNAPRGQVPGTLAAQYPGRFEKLGFAVDGGGKGEQTDLFGQE